MVMACDSLLDDDLLTKLRISFLDTPTMNQAWEDLRNLRQGENESITVYIYKWGCALVRSSEISAQNENHPHVIKDFISSLKRSIRNKIVNKWVEMRRKPRTVQDVFSLAADIETQIQVADSFKLDLMNDLPPVEVNEVSTGETSGEEYEVNKVYKGKKWSNNQYRKPNYGNDHNSNNRYQQKPRPQDKRSGKSWENKERDTKITLTKESSHFIPSQLSDDFFRQFDLAMKLKREELKKHSTDNHQVNELTEGDLIQAFGVTKDQMEKAAEILNRDKGSKKLGNSPF